MKNLVHSVKTFFNQPLSIWGLAAFLLILSACAQPAAPEGGPRDQTPPEAQKFVPDNYSTNFNSKTVVIEFDEYFRLNNVSQKMLTSPYMEEKPEVSIKRKMLIIELKEELLPNTTYTIHFGDAIVDNNEGNPLENFKYVFSTGDYIDSMEVKGKIIDAYTMEPVKGVNMMLYNDKSDSVPYLQKPAYLSQTNEEGEFTITNVKKGQYKAFALKDQNNNYLFDLPNESIAYTDSLVRADTSISPLTFFLFEEDHEKQYIKSFKSDLYGRFSLLFNLPVKNLTVHPLNHHFKKQWFIREMNAERDSVTYWLTGVSGLDTLSVEVVSNDSILDTLDLALVKKEKLKKDSLRFSTNVDQDILGLHKNLRLTLNHPVVAYDTSRIILKQDSIEVRPEFIFRDSALRVFEVAYDWKEKRSYTLSVLPGTFEDIFEMKNDSFMVGFNSRSKDYYGGLGIEISGVGKVPLILQLLTKEDRVFKTFYLAVNDRQIKLPHIPAGEYKLKLIRDENGNKKWDTGDYLKNKQPEKVIRYEKTIEVKSKWEQEIEWQLEPTSKD